ncbi:hypothetical protein RS130_18510 [Paraglaciecola aquimarina]|uniref:Uncharacterized protein n=1 Tax=Paraglaciecola aquimarina TaxID=1235557 RepID=A0ABU3T023_9ALTE|nr:hypothetical protein [Paraglaciecola aquimarina]MDU0355619.1 hypothetical protein [Paraglaciecola aquimarina]
MKLAMASNVKHMALYSHDHTRTDKQLIEIEDHCHFVIESANADVELFAAAEG